MPNIIDEKVGILDVRATLNNGINLDIEMQNINYGNITKRMTYYLNLLYTQELQKGKLYSKLNRTIAIGILNFDYFEDIKEHHTIWRMTEQNNKNKTLEEQEIHFIELPKFLRSNIDINRKLDQWLAFIDYSREELVKMAKEKNPQIREASATYDYLVGDENVRRLAFLRRKFELDYNSGMSDAKRKGMEQGMKEGLEQGMKEGLEQGEKNKQVEIAKKSKEKGLPIDTIIEITGLTKEEIDKL